MTNLDYYIREELEVRQGGAEQVTTTLVSGRYEVELVSEHGDEYRIQRFDDGIWTDAKDVELVGRSVQKATVKKGKTTFVEFQFKVDGKFLGFGKLDVVVGVEDRFEFEVKPTTAERGRSVKATGPLGLVDTITLDGQNVPFDADSTDHGNELLSIAIPADLSFRFKDCERPVSLVFAPKADEKDWRQELTVVREPPTVEVIEPQGEFVPGETVHLKVTPEHAGAQVLLNGHELTASYYWQDNRWHTDKFIIPTDAVPGVAELAVVSDCGRSAIDVDIAPPPFEAGKWDGSGDAIGAAPGGALLVRSEEPYVTKVELTDASGKLVAELDQVGPLPWKRRDPRSAELEPLQDEEDGFYYFSVHVPAELKLPLDEYQARLLSEEPLSRQAPSVNVQDGDSLPRAHSRLATQPRVFRSIPLTVSFSRGAWPTASRQDFLFPRGGIGSWYPDVPIDAFHNSIVHVQIPSTGWAYALFTGLYFNSPLENLDKFECTGRRQFHGYEMKLAQPSEDFPDDLTTCADKLSDGEIGIDEARACGVLQAYRLSGEVSARDRDNYVRVTIDRNKPNENLSRLKEEYVGGWLQLPPQSDGPEESDGALTSEDNRGRLILTSIKTGRQIVIAHRLSLGSERRCVFNEVY